MHKLNKEKLYLILIVLVVAAIVCVLAVGLAGRNESKKLSVPPKATEPIVRVEVKEVEKMVEVEKLVEVEKAITSEMIQDGLNDIGLLITDEYYFTEVVRFSSVLKAPIFHTDLKMTESSFLVSYDGVVTAGIDFGDIVVKKDDAAQTVSVKLPHATIRNVDIDPESFEKYSEKASMFNPLSIEDFNNSLIELETNAREKALEKGILKRADENAKSVVSNFIRSLVDTSVYSVKFGVL